MKKRLKKTIVIPLWDWICKRTTNPKSRQPEWLSVKIVQNGSRNKMKYWTGESCYRCYESPRIYFWIFL